MANGQVQQPRKQYASFLPEVLVLMIVSGAGYLTWRYVQSILEIGIGIAIIGLLIYRFQGWVINKFLWDRWRHRIFPAFRRLGGHIADHPPYLRRAERLPHGVALYVTLYDGITFRDLQNGADSLASSLKANRVIVRPDGKAHHAIIEVQYGDPFGDPPNSGPQTITTGFTPDGSMTLPIGQDESGHEVSVPLRAGGIVVGGLPGSGKSNFVHLLVAHFARLDGAKIYLIDPKRVELSGWRHRATRFGVSQDDAVSILDEIIGVMTERYQELEQRGERGSRSDKPPMLVVFEEVSTLLVGPRAKAIEERIRQVMALGRAAGIMVVLVAQRPGVDTLAGSVRDLADTRIAFRTSTPDMSDTILGRGSTASGFDASKITASLRGVAYLSTGEKEPTLVRCYLVDDKTLQELQRNSLPPEMREEN